MPGTQEDMLDGIQRALNITGKDIPGYPGDPDSNVMKNGQIILITDAQSQQRDTEEEVTSTAEMLQTCVHSYIVDNGLNNPNFFNLYKRLHQERLCHLMEELGNLPNWLL